MNREIKYTLILTSLYFILIYIGILNHEISFDEAQAWLIARDSNGIFELFQNLKYEGHPFLWHLLLFIISHFTNDPFWMQILHLFIATSSVFIFLKNAPFSWSFKILFIFGYFMIFEYSLISRNYILGVFLLFLASSYYKKNDNFIIIILLLTLTLFVHVFFALVAVSFFLLLLIDNIRLKTPYFKIGIGIFILGFILFIYQLIPPTDTFYFASKSKISILERMIHSGSFLIKGLLILPDFRLFHFWNTNLIINYSKYIALIFTIFLSIIPCFLFSKNLKIMFFTYFNFLGLFLLIFITQVAGSRFSGVSYIVIIIGLWLNAQSDIKTNRIGSSLKFSIFNNFIIYTILLTHFISGMYAYSMDIKYAFFNSNSLIDYIYNNKLDKKEIVVLSYEGVALSALLQRKVFFLSLNEYQSFCISKYDYKIVKSQNEVLSLLYDYSKQKSNYVFVSYIKLNEISDEMKWKKTHSNLYIKYLNHCKTGIINNFDLYIYEVSIEEK